MINPDTELDKLRWNLRNSGLDYQDVDVICDAAANDINEIILDVISNATAEAISYAEDIGAEKFLEDIDVILEGSIYIVGTKSGSADYSTPKVENLPNLLRNAEVAKDGSRYKVIPIKDKGPKVRTTMFDTVREQQEQIKETRKSLLESSGERSARASAMAESFKQSLNRTVNYSRTEATVGGTTSFRTASSKQNSSTSWVIPEKDRDMTQFLMSLNDNIRDTIESSISTIISSYEQEYT